MGDAKTLLMRSDTFMTDHLLFTAAGPHKSISQYYSAFFTLLLIKDERNIVFYENLP